MNYSIDMNVKQILFPFKILFVIKVENVKHKPKTVLRIHFGIYAQEAKHTLAPNGAKSNEI